MAEILERDGQPCRSGAPEASARRAGTPCMTRPVGKETLNLS
ncbi:hypothetical protein [Bosea robiniae]|jgi:hypothetical protein|nr:hypothetical protein [Bosea robiniae]